MNSNRRPTKEARKFFEQAAAAVDRVVDGARGSRADDPVPLLQQWVALVCAHAFPQQPQLRSPASEASIHDAEARLGLSLPTQLRAVYLATDGLEWTGKPVGTMSYAGVFPPMASLAFAAPLPDRLSTRGKRSSLNASAIRPAALLKIYPATVFGFLETPLAELSTNEVQAYLALQTPQARTSLLLTPANGLNTPYGSVIAVEGGSGTLFDSLSHWLSVQLKLHSEL